MYQKFQSYPFLFFLFCFSHIVIVEEGSRLASTRLTWTIFNSSHSIQSATYLIYLLCSPFHFFNADFKKYYKKCVLKN